MTDETINPILRRMATRSAPRPEDVPVTSSRAVRMAMTRAADTSVGLSLSVLGLREEVLPLDAVAEALGDGLMFMRLDRGSVMRGVAAIDTELRGAIIEIQTTGKLRPVVTQPRPATGTDAMLVEPFLNGFLNMLTVTTPKTDLEGWAADVVAGRRVETARAAALALVDQDYRMIRLSLDLGVGGRQGELSLLLPAGRQPEPVAITPEATKMDWTATFAEVVETAPATLNAILHSFKLPLRDANALEVGQVIPLPGCDVGGARLKSIDGRTVARGRLGQYGGMRALRVSGEPGLTTGELLSLPVSVAAPDYAGPEAIGYGGLAAEPELMTEQSVMTDEKRS